MRFAITFACIATSCLTGLGGCEQSAGNSDSQFLSAEDSASPCTAWFADITATSGVNFVHDSGAAGEFLFPEIIGGGAALVDLDNSGRPDLYLVQSGHLRKPAEQQPGNQLYRNLGNSRFENVTQASGADDRGYGMGVAAGDYNNDGFIDLYITNVGPNVLLRNEGNMRFTDVTAEAGTGDRGWGTSAAFVDYDHDGLLDLFVVNYIIWSFDNELQCMNASGEQDYCSPTSYSAPQPDVLYRNLGNGVFDDVSSFAGLRSAFGNGLGVVCADVDLSGWIDVFVANDMNDNQLWHNQGDGTFREIAHFVGVAVDRHGEPHAGMGVHVADLYDNAFPDIIVVNRRDHTGLFHRNDGRYFSDPSDEVGLAAETQAFTGFGVGVHDFDNDGWLDCYIANGRVVRSPELAQIEDNPYAEANVLLRGNTNPRFTEVQPRGGTNAILHATSRAAAFGDIDGDGGIDIVVVNRDGPVHVLRNVAADRGNWITFRVIDQHGRDAMHASLRIIFGQRTIYRDVRSAYSYLTANDPRVTVGLGEAGPVHAVKVTWPDQTTEDFGPFDPNREVTLRYGEGRR